jgi:hypothetical protein
MLQNEDVLAVLLLQRSISIRKSSQHCCISCNFTTPV